MWTGILNLQLPSLKRLRITISKKRLFKYGHYKVDLFEGVVMDE